MECAWGFHVVPIGCSLVAPGVSVGCDGMSVGRP